MTDQLMLRDNQDNPNWSFFFFFLVTPNW